MRSQLGQEPERLLGLDLGLPVLEDARAGGLRLRAVREAVDLHGPPEAELRPAGVHGRLRVGGELPQRLVLRRGSAHAADGRVKGAVALLEQLLELLVWQVEQRQRAAREERRRPRLAWPSAPWPVALPDDLRDGISSGNHSEKEV